MKVGIYCFIHLLRAHSLQARADPSMLHKDIKRSSSALDSITPPSSPPPTTPTPSPSPSPKKAKTKRTSKPKGSKAEPDDGVDDISSSSGGGKRNYSAHQNGAWDSAKRQLLLERLWSHAVKTIDKDALAEEVSR